MKKITLFSDGSALGNPGPGGYGTILRFGDHEKINIQIEGHSALEVKGTDTLVIRSDMGQDHDLWDSGLKVVYADGAMEPLSARISIVDDDTYTFELLEGELPFKDHPAYPHSSSFFDPR